MPGNLRKKLGPNQREREYLRARKQVLRQSQICSICLDAIDLKLPLVCARVDTRGFTVENAHEIPTTCGPDCDHKKKPNPWSGSADHLVPVEQLRPGDPRLVSAKGLVASHLICNQRKSNGTAKPVAKYVTSGDWF